MLLADATIVKLARKGFGQLRLLLRDPEKFVRNLRQFTDPARFLDDLLDVPTINPLRIEIDNALPAGRPALVVLLPSIARHGMTGGPNTVLMIGARLAHAGMTVRFVSCDAPVVPDTGWFWTHLGQLTGMAGTPPHATLQDACGAPLRLGARDLLLASFWTTAHQAAGALKLMGRETFVYLIQDFEPGFYAWSSRYALSMATLDLPFRAVINEATLADFLFETRVGRFADDAFRTSCHVFEPAIDRGLFSPADHARPRPRRLLVYARPTNPRNLLGLAVASLKAALASSAFTGDWEFLAIGARGSVPQIPLGGGRVLREAPWSDLAGYAALLRDADILLTPMLSPHTGYPVLEMAASGGIAVTNSFATKTVERLSRLSANIIAVDATVEGFTRGLIEAAGRVARGIDSHARLRLPRSWDGALAEVEGVLLAELGGATGQAAPASQSTEASTKMLDRTDS